MNRTTKVILGVVGGLVVVGILACVGIYLTVQALAKKAMENVLITEPTQVAAVAAEIADYDMPDGYTQAAMNFFGLYKMLVIAGSEDGVGEKLVFMLMQLPMTGDVDQEQMARQMEQSFLRQSGREGVEWEKVGEESVEIRGETVTLVIQEGANEQGDVMRAEAGVFEGKNGPVMLMIMGAKDHWDQKVVDTFIASIR